MKWNLTIEGDSPSELLSLLNGAAGTVQQPLHPAIAKIQDGSKIKELEQKPEPAKPVATKAEETKAEAAKTLKPEPAKTPEAATLEMCIKAYNEKKGEGMTPADAKELAAKHGGTKISDVPKENLAAFYSDLTKWAK